MSDISAKVSNFFPADDDVLRIAGSSLFGIVQSQLLLSRVQGRAKVPVGKNLKLRNGSGNNNRFLIDVHRDLRSALHRLLGDFCLSNLLATAGCKHLNKERKGKSESRPRPSLVPPAMNVPNKHCL